MKTAGIVAEFNPFHNGHAALIRQARRQGATHVVAVMSGNFVQRGGPAIAEKRVRARCALQGGADLVLELPVAHATATASRFAWGAVSILAASGGVDMLCFGSESGNLEELERLALLLEEEELSLEIRRRMQTGKTWAAARQAAVLELHGPKAAALLETPNNALALEYLRAARSLNWNPEWMTMSRKGAGHHQMRLLPGSRYASASALRTMPLEFGRLKRYLPEDCLRTLEEAAGEGIYPVQPEKLETAVLSHLRRMSPVQMAELPDLSEGLENRMYQAVRRAVSMEGLYQDMKTRRYTLARIRRLVLHAFLDITARDQKTPPPYIRILGIGERGQEVLTAFSGATLPVSSRLARLRETGTDAARFAALEEQATDLYTLALPSPRPCGYDLTAGGVYLK